MIVESPISVGELIDKITILDIKLSKISDNTKLLNIRNEHSKLTDRYTLLQISNTEVNDLRNDLFNTNSKLWDIEDRIRECEKSQSFGDEFIQLARSVYMTNDRRSEIKKKINLIVGSEIVEEKSYTEYTSSSGNIST